MNDLRLVPDPPERYEGWGLVGRWVGCLGLMLAPFVMWAGIIWAVYRWVIR